MKKKLTGMLYWIEGRRRFHKLICVPESQYSFERYLEGDYDDLIESLMGYPYKPGI